MSRTPGAKDTKPRNYNPNSRPPKGGNGFVGEATNARVPADYNAKQIQFMREILPTEPLDPDDVDEMERRFNHYLDVCARYDIKMGNQAAATAIGTTASQLICWERETKSNPTRAAFCKKVRQLCAMYREGLMADGKVNPVTGIFWQKNYDGLRDQSEVILTPNTDPLGDKKDAEQLKDKYLGMQTQNKLPDKSQNG